MAFNAQGYRQAATQAGVPKEVIEKTIADKTGTMGWLTSGKQGLGGVVSAIGNVLNLPSYALGGLANRFQQATGSQYAQGNREGLGIVEGIKNKRGLMTEAPETFGVDPNSFAGKAIGFGAELLAPDLLGSAGDLYKLSRGAGVASDVGMAGRLINKTGSNIEDVGKMTPFRGLGRNNTTQRMLNQIEKIGMTPDQFADTYKLWNRDIDEVNDVLSAVDSAYKTASRTGDVSTQGIMRAFDTNIQKLAGQAGQSRSARAELDRLIEARDGFLQSIQQGGQTPFTPLRTPLSSVAEAKSIVSKDIPQSYFNLGGVQKGAGKGAERARQIYKGTIDTATGGQTAKLGGAESALLDYRKLLNKQRTAQAGNKNISFPKMIAPFGGYAFGGLPGAAATYGAEMFLNSPTGLKAQSKLLTSAGRMLQTPTAGRIVDKTVRGIGKTAGTGFRVSQQPNLSQSGVQQPQRSSQQVLKRRSPSYSTNSTPQNFNIKLFTKRNTR